MDSLYQTVNGLVGNVDWGESLVVVACEFPGLNTLHALSFDPNSHVHAFCTRVSQKTVVYST